QGLRGQRSREARQRQREGDRRGFHSTITTPYGTRPTGMLLTALAPATSITVTSSLRPLTTHRRCSALSSVTFHARLPTSTRSVTLRPGTSTKATWLALPSATNARLPSRLIVMPTGE